MSMLEYRAGEIVWFRNRRVRFCYEHPFGQAAVVSELDGSGKKVVLLAKLHRDQPTVAAGASGL
jgi:superfamily I DNA and RNA helicase